MVAIEFQNVRINSISQGMVATSFHENLPKDQLKGYREPEEIKEVLLKLLDDSEPVNGEIFSSENLKTWVQKIKYEE